MIKEKLYPVNLLTNKGVPESILSSNKHCERISCTDIIAYRDGVSEQNFKLFLLPKIIESRFLGTGVLQ